MDEKLIADMVQDMRDAVGFVSPPDHAMSLVEFMKAADMPKDTARRAMKALVENLTWKRQRVGNKTYYWKVIDG